MNYCMDCGAKLELRPHHEGGEVPFCPVCGKFRHPVYSTAVIMIVMDKARERVILIQQYGRAKNILVAGYIDRGESAEAACVREVREGERVRYIRTVKRRVDLLRAVEEEAELSEAEYTAALADADPTRRPIAKTRYCIPYAGHTVEVDVYDFWQDRATAEVELASESEELSLPPYLKVLREVTEDKRYKNVNLARELPVDA